MHMLIVHMQSPDMSAARFAHLRTTLAGEQMFALTTTLRGKRQESSVSTHGLFAVYLELSMVKMIDHLCMAVPLSAVLRTHLSCALRVSITQPLRYSL